MEDDTYRCPRCRTTKPLTEFNRDRSRRHGHSIYCKLCTRAANQAWRDAHPDQLRASIRKCHAGASYKAYQKAYHRARNQQKTLERRALRKDHLAKVMAVAEG